MIHVSLLCSILFLQKICCSVQEHPREGWSYYVNNSGTLFVQLGDAPIIEGWIGEPDFSEFSNSGYGLVRKSVIINVQRKKVPFRLLHLKFPREKIFEIYTDLRKTMCNNAFTTKFPSFLGFMVLIDKNEPNGNVNLFLTDDHLSYSDLLAETIASIIKTKPVTAVEDIKGLCNLFMLGPWHVSSCYFENIRKDERSPNFLEAPNLVIWSDALLALISRMRDSKNVRLVVRRSDVKLEGGEFDRFDILCSPEHSVNLFASIVFEHSVTYQHLGRFYGKGFENMLKASFEITQDSDALISLYYKASSDDAFKQEILDKFDQLAYSIYWQNANTLHTTSKAVERTSSDWELIAKHSGATTRGGFYLTDFLAFEKILDNLPLKTAEKKNHQVWICPEGELLHASFRPQELVLNFRIPNLELKHLLIRLYLDVVSSGGFNFAPYISRYAIFTVENRGPFYFSVYFINTKLPIPLLDEIRAIFYLFLKSIGYDDPYAHISISAKGKDIKSHYKTLLDVSAHIAIPLIKAIECRQIVCESEPKRVSSTIKRSKSSKRKTNKKIACELNGAVHNDIWADYIEAEIDSVHKTQENVDNSFASWSLYECIEE